MALLSPGILSTEIDLSLVASNAGSTNGAFGGKFNKGYAGKAVLITNVAELEENFGKPSNDNFNDWYQAYYYLQYTNNLYVSRAVDENGAWNMEENTVREVNELGKVEITGNPDNIFVGTYVKFDADSEDEFKVKAIELPDEGAKHRLTIEINTVQVGDYSVRVGERTFTTSVTEPEKDTITVNDIANRLSLQIDLPGVAIDMPQGSTVLIEAVNPGVEIDVGIVSGPMVVYTAVEPKPVESYELVFDDETDFSEIAFKGANVFTKTKSVNAFKFIPVEDIEQGDDVLGNPQEAIVVFPFSATQQIPYEELYKNEDDYDVLEESIPFPDNMSLKFIARGFGVYGNKIQIAIAREKDFKDVSNQVLPGVALGNMFEYKPLDSKKEFAVIVSENGVIKEKFIVSTDPNAKDYQNRSMFVDDVFRRKSSLVYCKSNPGIENLLPKSCLNDEILTLSNGFNGTIGISEIKNSYGSVSDSTIFGDTEGLDIDYVIANELVRTAAGELAVSRGDCLAVIGANYEIVGQKSTKIVELLLDDVNNGEIASGSTRNSYCAYFGNYAQIWDTYNDKYRWISVAGMVAGRRAQTTYELQPWYASAGEIQGQLKGVTKWAFSPNVGARDKMYVSQINSIVRFPGRGDQVFGQKTLQAANSAFSRVNVRLLFNYIKRNLSVALRGFVFELNDQYTRNRVEALCKQFLQRVKTLRGLYDYGVQCNGDNNTAQVIDDNSLVCDIALKPVRTAEFIYLNLYCVGTDVNISEVFRKA